MVRFTNPFEGFERMVPCVGGRWRRGIMPIEASELDGLSTLRFDLPGVDSDSAASSSGA